MDRISVVIPTQGRIAALSRTLSAVADQELGDLELELILVCSGSPRPYRERVRAVAASLTLPVKVLARADGGAAGARNAGVGAADAELVLFLNDDTPPLSRRLVRSHAEMHAGDRDEWHGVLGPVVWDPEIDETPVMTWLARTGKMNDYSELAPGAARRPVLYAPNLSLRRSALLEVGGFDERFWRYSWEEYDLALRLGDRGFELSFAPDLVVGHHHRYSLHESLRRMESVGRGANLLNRVHRARDGLGTPAPSGIKAWIGRAAAPLAARLPVPSWVPPGLQDPVFRALHFAMLARGYSRSPIPVGSGPEGAIPGRVELVA